MIRSVICIFCVIGLMVCGISPAGEVFAQEWTFEQLAREAGSTHPSILSKQQSRDSALAEVESAKWQRWPTPGISTNVDDEGDGSLTLSLQQPLWTGGRITAGIEAAESLHGASREDVQKAWREVLSRVIDAYVEAVRRKSHQSIHYRNVQQHERLLGMITRRVEQEASPQVDRDLAQARLYQAANDLSFVTQQLTIALTRLSELTGKEVARVAPLEDIVSGMPESKSAAIDDAVSKSPTLANLAFRMDAAEADIKSRKSAYWPAVALRLESREGYFWEQGGDRLSDQRALIVLESQLGAGLAVASNVKAAISRREAVVMEREDALRDLRTTVSEAWDELVAARIRLKNAILTRKSSATVFESYARQYTIGHKSWLDVMNSVRESTQAEILAEDANAEVVRTTQRLRLLTDNLNIPRVSYAK
jgi:outer membrane protein, adhesin transport system